MECWPTLISCPKAQTCQSCIAGVNLTWACEDKVWPLLHGFVDLLDSWPNCIDHRWEQLLPHATERVCHSKNIPFHFFFFILCCLFHLFIPGVVSTLKSIFHERWPDLWGLQMVTMVWNRMINNRRKVLDRDLFIYDYTPWQQIYSIPTEKSARLGSFTEATVIHVSSVMCLNNYTIFVALDVALWENIAVEF